MKAQLILTETPYIEIEGTKIEKPIDYNGIDFGIVDVEKLAEEKYPLTMVSIFTQTSLVDKNKERRNIFIEGFKASQQLNEKKFSEVEVVDYLEWICGMGWYFEDKKRWVHDNEVGCFNSTKDLLNHYKLLSIPKTFDIEIEETPTNIKIIKKL